MARNNTNSYIWIPVLAAIVLIPQLLFWWLAPADAAARMAVYAGGTALTVAIPLLVFLTYRRKNLRETAGLFVVAGILDLVVIGICVVLLTANASVRSAVFAFAILALACLVILVPMIASAVNGRRQGVYPAGYPSDLNDEIMPDEWDRCVQVPNEEYHRAPAPDERSRRAPMPAEEYRRTPMPAEEYRCAPALTPLPPRNR